MEYFGRVAEVAYKKLKPTSADLPSRRMPTKKYFSIRLAGGDREAILQMLRNIGFKAYAGPLTDLEKEQTIWRRDFETRAHGTIYQINAFKPANRFTDRLRNRAIRFGDAIKRLVARKTLRT